MSREGGWIPVSRNCGIGRGHDKDVIEERGMMAVMLMVGEDRNVDDKFAWTCVVRTSVHGAA